MAVATVVLFGTLAMFIYPMMFPLLGWDEGLYGIYIGSTIHEVAQVVAAGNAVGEQAMAALGFQTRIEALRHQGMKPFVLASLLFVALLVGGAVMTPALIG